VIRGRSFVGARWVRAMLCVLLFVAARPLHCENVAVMHGFADQSSFTLWVQSRGPASIEVEFGAEGNAGTGRIIRRDALEAHDFAVAVRLADLEPGTSYRYRLRVDGDAAEVAGHFRTQPLWEWRTDPPEVSIAFGSCAYLDDGRFDRPGTPFGAGYGIFDAIADQRPDAMLWLGDNVYFREPEWTSLEAMSARYRFYRSSTAIERLWRATSHLATWDDHDDGPNDSGAAFVMKSASMQAFTRYWPNPSHGLPGVPGVFTQVRIADADIFLLDDRWYRYPNRYPNVPEKVLLGAGQLEWLKQSLLDSDAAFKIVAMGTQFWNRVSRFETWQNYPEEQKQLSDWLRDQRIAGVIFLSGDRHFSELLRVPREGTYPLYEFTSSPLTAGVVARPDAQEIGNPDFVPGTMVTQRSFGMVRITGPKSDRAIALESYDAAGAVLWRRELRAAELR